MDATNYPARKRRLLLWLMLVAAVDAGIGPFVESNQSEKAQIAVFGFITGFSVRQWCSLDSMERHAPFGLLLGLTIVFVTVIGVPIYLLRSRGLRGLLAVGKAALFLVALGIIAFVTEQLVSYIALAVTVGELC
jgi:hypothetical protein